MWSVPTFVFVFLLWRFGASDIQEQGWTVQVEPKSEECLYLHRAAGSKIDARIEVITGGLLDIRIMVNGPDRLLYDETLFFKREDPVLNEKIGTLSIPVSSTGLHSICANNRMSRWTAKKLTVYVLGVKPEFSTLENAKLEHLGPVVDSVIKISEELDAAVRIQHQLRLREASHRNTQESTNARVQWLSITESTVMVSLSLLQLYFIKSWFGDSNQQRRRV